GLYSYHPFPPRGAFMRRQDAGKGSALAVVFRKHGTGTLVGTVRGHERPAAALGWTGIELRRRDSVRIGALIRSQGGFPRCPGRRKPPGKSRALVPGSTARNAKPPRRSAAKRPPLEREATKRLDAL